MTTSTHSPSGLAMLSAIGAAVGMATIGVFSRLVVEAGKIPWLLAIGFIPGCVALYCAVLALQRLPTAVYGTLSYFEPVAVIVFGWLFFAETLSAGQFLGCVLILGSGIGPALTAAVTARPIAVK